jgi:hypothetical protein
LEEEVSRRLLGEEQAKIFFFLDTDSVLGCLSTMLTGYEQGRGGVSACKGGVSALTKALFPPSAFSRLDGILGSQLEFLLARSAPAKNTL